MHNECKTTPGLTAKNFRQIARNGFGDLKNSYPHSMAWFKDHLYVGTSRNVLAMTKVMLELKKTDVNMAIWPVQQPDNPYRLDLSCQIWRYSPHSNTWSKVYTSPLVEGKNGFKVPLSIGFRCMTSYQGANDHASALYVSTMGGHHWPETVLLRSFDGTNFEIASKPKLKGHPIPRGSRSIAVFKGRLFLAPLGGSIRGQPNTADVMNIMVTSDADAEDWKPACEPHFGNPNNRSVCSMAIFNDYLYAGTLNISEGFQIWKTDAEGTPPYRWTKVLSHGAYRGRLNQIAMTMAPFGEHLYVGSAIQSGGYDRDNNVGPAAPEVIRVHPDDSWDLIVGEPRITRDGLKAPLSGLGPGFNNPLVGYIWQMCEHEGWLYLGTAVISAFLRYIDWDSLPEMRDIVDPIRLDNFLWNFGGCDFWRSRDGMNWVPVTLSGFGNPYNYGVRTMASTPFGLFVGIANPFGPKVALKRVAGWKYETNELGGLEIWQSTNEFSDREPLSPLTEGPYSTIKNSLINGKGEKNQTDRVQELVSEFYGHTGFRHIGFWHTNINDVQRACENLVDEILAFIPHKSGTILDVGCGLGATTRRLQKHFSLDAITGVTVHKKDIDYCRYYAPGVKFLYMKLPNLKFQSGSFDHAICVEGPGRFGTEKLLDQIFRVLRPGGSLVFSDILYSEKSGKRNYIRRNKDSPRDSDAYQKLLENLGFQDVKILDITFQCWTSFYKHIAEYLEMKTLANEINGDTALQVKSYLCKDNEFVTHYLLVSARKMKNDQIA